MTLEAEERFRAREAEKARPVAEGETVRIRVAALNWYQRRPAIAVTGDTRDWVAIPALGQA